MNTSLFKRTDIEMLYNDLLRANTETAKKERFHQYLTKAFHNDQSAQELISAMALGAERTIANIPRAQKTSVGRADTQTETVIIEWEKDLTRTGLHAIDQLSDYLTGNWHSGDEYRFILIATDGIKWRIYAPNWEHLEKRSFLSNDYKLTEVRAFDLNPNNLDDFPFFLDEILFLAEQKSANIENIRADFGNTSNTFINSLRILEQCLAKHADSPEINVALDQWRRFLSIAYSTFDDSPQMFLVHTYLSIFAKLIAYNVVAQKPIYDEEDDLLISVLHGDEFNKFGVERFVEDDFFHWVSTKEYFPTLRPMFRLINTKIAAYDFKTVEEDILKGVYQELIDLETRHALGEYYTPDWLCEKIISELNLNQDSFILDLTSGSGSFLRAVVYKLRSNYKDITADQIAAHVVGIDIHPLSVQISKTTLLLSLGDLLAKTNKPVTLHVYLANSLFVPQSEANLFHHTFKIVVDNKRYAINTSGIASPDEFDSLIAFCDDLVNLERELITKQQFRSLAVKQSNKYGASLVDELYKVYAGLRAARVAGRDSIWKFIIQNSYKPVFLKQRFDFVVGNPPWLTYADVSNADYQGMLKLLSDEYSVTPDYQINMPHLEIAAIFLAHAVNYFLKPTGSVAFVLPRSFMSADQHHNMRSGKVINIKLASIWDLDKVVPLFRVPSCVFFAKYDSSSSTSRVIPVNGIPGKTFSGRLPRPHIHWQLAAKYLSINDDAVWYYSLLKKGKKRERSAITSTPFITLKGANAYYGAFRQGATILPRSFYFIQLDEGIKPEDCSGKVISVDTPHYILGEAKKPWKNIKMSGSVDGDFVFTTALSNNVVPFSLAGLSVVTLPVTINTDGKKQYYVIHEPTGLLSTGARYTSRWFKEAIDIWEKNKTEKAKQNKMTLYNRLDYQTGITSQNPDNKYMVLFTSSSSDACAVVIERDRIKSRFIVEHKTYWCEVDGVDQAHYLAAYLNSRYTNFMIKEFQSRGLFGPRDIHKTILMIPFPKYNKNIPDHFRLAELGALAHQIAYQIVSKHDTNYITKNKLGRLRSKIRGEFGGVLDEIDIIVERLSTGRMENYISKKIRDRINAKKKKNMQMDSLFDNIS
jgi:type I restriction-modification system DNA methylase subunit